MKLDETRTKFPEKKVTLYDHHVKLGAKMIPFAGYEMPVWYDSQITEHHAVRNEVGIFDVSHMGEFFVEGDDAVHFLHYITSNDVKSLAIGQAQYSCLPNYNGGIIDDLLVYRLEEEKFMLVVNAANLQKDWDWLLDHTTPGAKMSNLSWDTSLFAVQGPRAIDTLNPLTDIELNDIPYYHFKEGVFAGAERVIISNTGYTGAGGFELYVENDDAQKVWDAIMESGKAHNIRPVGLAARDTLRLEMGFCLYGNDIDDETSPLEAGLGWITKLDKKFLSSHKIIAQKEAGLTRRLRGFEVLDKGIARQGHLIFDSAEGGEQIGKVTSGTKSPTLNKAIGMGYVKKGFTKVDTEIFIEVREGKRLKALVKKVPFLKK